VTVFLVKNVVMIHQYQSIYKQTYKRLTNRFTKLKVIHVKKTASLINRQMTFKTELLL